MPTVSSSVTRAASRLFTLAGFALAVACPGLFLIDHQALTLAHLRQPTTCPVLSGQEGLVALIMGCVLYYLATYFLKVRWGQQYAFANLLSSVLLIIALPLHDPRVFGAELTSLAVGLMASLWLAILATQLIGRGAPPAATRPAPPRVRWRASATWGLGHALTMLALPATLYFLLRITQVWPGA